MKAEDPKLVAIARALFEGHNPDDGYEKPARTTDVHFYDTGESTFGDPDRESGSDIDHSKLIALHHFSALNYNDGDTSQNHCDHGLILRHPGEDPEKLFQRALKITATSMHPTIEPTHHPGTPNFATLKDYAEHHDFDGVDEAAIEYNHAGGSGDDSFHGRREHYFFPVHRA